MREAAIVSTARTPIGKATRGAFNDTHGGDLAGHVITHAIARSGLDPAEIEDVVIGCGLPEDATGHNIARIAAIRRRHDDQPVLQFRAASDQRCRAARDRR